MVRWLKRRSTGRGEWSVADLHRDYRMCNYNDEHHGGPHIHVPINGPVVGVAALTESEADLMVRRYGSTHEAFDLASFNQEVITWKSESKKT
ncbi:MAG: hypothetical protein HYT80_08820 [Euryarchaeota archaeon]|nr:hypothetical protein [Euryarchaeota archaeon]